MNKKKKKTVMFVAVLVISLALLILWFFQLKINLQRFSGQDSFFSTIKNIIKKTDDSYKENKLKNELMNLDSSNEININKLKDKVLQNYVKETIKEAK